MVVLPEPEFADHAEGFAGADDQRDVVDRLDRAVAAGKYILRPTASMIGGTSAGHVRTADPDRRLVLELQHRADQHARIGIGRLVEDPLHRPVFHHLAVVHDEHVVGDFGDDAHVVGDEHRRPCRGSPGAA